MKGYFFGGVHPDGKKGLTAGIGPVEMQPPRRVIILLKQHVGSVCTPLVKPGDRVKMGQKIGDGEGLCTPVHSSVSGVVAAVEPRPQINGAEVLSVVVDNDQLDTPAGELQPVEDIASLTDEQLLDSIREAGIVGMGGAMFPTEIKANVPSEKIDTVIVNACECEPYITADDLLLRTSPERVLEGLRIMCRVARPKRAVVAIEDNKPEAAAALRKAMGDYPEAELVQLPTRYPQGAEKQLIVAVTGREVPSGKLPRDVGCAVFNAATFAAIAAAVHKGEPLIRRIVTVTGEGVAKPCNFIARVGTPVSELVEAAGGLKGGACKVIAGGPMMGAAQINLEAPMVKGTNAIVCLENPFRRQPGSCIRCGRCAEACPMRLQPLYMYRFEAAGDREALRRLHLMDCMECGSCAYVCPAELPLVDSFRRGKAALREEKK